MVGSKLITVFGGSGLIGRYTVRALAKAGYRLRICVRRPNLANYLLPMGHVGQIALSKADLRDGDAVAEAVAGASAVINLAGALFPRGQSFDQIHVRGPALLAKTAKRAGIETLVHVSAIGADLEAESAYGRSKAEGENAIREAFPEATILRPSAVFGPEDKFFNQFAALARFSPVLPLPGGGHTKLQPVFAGDVAAAILRAIENRDTAGKTFELGGPNIYSFRALMELLLAEINRKRLLLPVPYPFMMMKATFAQFVPGVPLSRDLVKFSRHDNVVSGELPGFAELGIKPDSVEAVIPTYLWRFRRDGQFAKAKFA